MKYKRQKVASDNALLLTLSCVISHGCGSAPINTADTRVKLRRDAAARWDGVRAALGSSAPPVSASADWHFTATASFEGDATIAFTPIDAFNSDSADADVEAKAA